MNGWDILILLLIAGAVALAVRHLVKNRGNSCHGGADCAACRQRCEMYGNDKKRY
ncbi:MAG: FeoB-associated Cys-rich membrane protein [Firmicutes bacterium]|nr:FeoB-associated Cys-rich membrane protein [Bacillota bacterium]